MNVVDRLKSTASASSTVMGWAAISSAFCTAIFHAPARASIALVSVTVVAAFVMTASIGAAVVWSAVATFRFDVRLSRHIAEVRKGLEIGSVRCCECGKSLSTLIDDVVKERGRGPVRMAFVRGAWFCKPCADALGIPKSWREDMVLHILREAHND